MPFVKFTESGRSFKPRVSVRQNGTIGINYASLNRWKIDRFDWVLLFYDAENKQIGIKPISEEEDGAHKLNFGKNKKSAWIGCRKFLDYFEIGTKKTEKYQVTWNDANSMLVIQM